MRAKRAQQEGLQGNKLQSKSLCRDYTQITLVDPVSHGAILPDGRSGTSGSGSHSVLKGGGFFEVVVS